MTKFFIPLGVIFGLIASYLVYQKLDRNEAMLAPSYYLALTKEMERKALFSGESVGEQHLDTIQVPNSGDMFGLNANLIEDTEENRAWIVGKKINTTIPPGRVFTYNLFEDLSTDRLDEVIPLGKRAISIDVDTRNSLNNRVVPGNRIDIIGVMSNDRDEEPQSIVVLEDVKVLGVGKALTLAAYEKDESNTYSTITIEVTPEEGRKLMADKKRVGGEFILFLRNQCDTNSPSTTCN